MEKCTEVLGLIQGVESSDKVVGCRSLQAYPLAPEVQGVRDREAAGENSGGTLSVCNMLFLLVSVLIAIRRKTVFVDPCAMSRGGRG